MPCKCVDIPIVRAANEGKYFCLKCLAEVQPNPFFEDNIAKFKEIPNAKPQA